MVALDAALMWAVAPRNSGQRLASQTQIITAVGAVLAPTLASFEIDPPLRAAHFLAQTCTESDGFVTTVEYASGDAYNGRADLGNTQPGDGPRFKGRGLIQLTGRANYQRYGTLLGIDLVDSPDTAADPVISLKIACEFWKLNGLNALADQDNIEAITQRINGGLNGLDTRQHYLALAKAALGLTAAAPVVQPVLQNGASGDAVRTLQQALVRAGIAIAVDGAFGPGTVAAVQQFQQAQGLTADGVVGAQTWAKLGVTG